ncbi:unnamed protein product [Arabidopsis halleri]
MRKKKSNRDPLPPHAVGENPSSSPPSLRQSSSGLAAASPPPRSSPPSAIASVISPPGSVDSVKSSPCPADMKSCSPILISCSAAPFLSSPPPPSIDYGGSAKVANATDPASSSKTVSPSVAPWAGLFKGHSKRLEKKGTAFTLPSGEACVKIPNSVIEKHKRSWDCFIIGQFYTEPPAQGTLHAIVNGIWSKFHRDISVTKMEGNAYLFRIPNSATHIQEY